MGEFSGLGLELKEMISLIGRQQDLISSLGEKGAHLDERKETLSQEVEELRDNLNAVSSELTKANDIIQKLQEERSQHCRKLKMQENILTSQDAQLKAKDERLTQTSTALNVANERVTSLESELEEMKQIRDEMKERCHEFGESLATKESMITYLSKQVIDSEGGSKQMILEITLLRDTNSKLETELAEIQSGQEDVDGRLKLAEQDLKSKENIIINLNKKLDESEGLSKLMSQEIQVLRKNNSKLDSDYHEKQRALGHLAGKTGGMETELRDKTALIARQQELIANLGEKGAQMESKKECLEREVEDIKMHVRDITSELGKANEIIRKLQEDGRQLTRRLKAHDNVLNSQEVQLKQKTEGLSKSTAALKSATERMTKLEGEVDELKLGKIALEERVRSAEENVAGKENMISYLSKQLNDYEGLANLDKFRQTLTLSNSLNDTTNGKTPTAASSWMHMYNSTLGTTNPSIPPHSGNLGSDDTGKKKSTLPTPTVRTPAWAKSNKATLDNLLSKGNRK